MKPPLKKALVLTCICLASIELSLFILEQNGGLDEPDEWGARGVVAWKINDCKRLFDAHPDRYRILIVGDSRAEMAIWPEKIDNYFNNRTITYNFAFSGTGADFHAFFIIHYIIKQFQADFVIWDINYNDFNNDSYQLEQDEELNNIPMVRMHENNYSGLKTRDLMRLLLLRFSRIFRYKSVLLPPALNPYLENRREYDYRHGFWETYVNEFYSGETTTTEMEMNFALHPPAYAKYRQAIEELKAAAIPFLVVTPPHAILRYKDPAIEAVFADLGTNFFSFNGHPDLVNSSLYYNSDHLNAHGATVLTQILCEQIDPRVSALWAGS